MNIIVEKITRCFGERISEDVALITGPYSGLIDNIKF